MLMTLEETKTVNKLSWENFRDSPEACEHVLVFPAD
jgi:hypothetical protein